MYIKKWQPLRPHKASCGLHILLPSFYPQNAAARIERIQRILTLHDLHGATVDPLEQYLSYAAPHQARVHSLKATIEGEKTTVIWSFIGGSGCSQIIDQLDREGYTPPPHATPKLLVGFSDTTALALLWHRWGWPVLHAPCLGLTRESADCGVPINTDAPLIETLNILINPPENLSYQLHTLYSPQESMHCAGSLYGGIITILKEGIGTATPPTRGDILFLEYYGPGHPAYLSREILYLCRAGLISPMTKALFLGNIGLEKDTRKALIEDIIASFQAHGINIPIVYSPDFGHGPRNHPLPLGQETALAITDKTATITVKL